MKKAALKDSTGQKVNDSRREKVVTWNSEKGRLLSASGNTQSGGY